MLGKATSHIKKRKQCGGGKGGFMSKLKRKVKGDHVVKDRGMFSKLFLSIGLGGPGGV